VELMRRELGSAVEAPRPPAECTGYMSDCEDCRDPKCRARQERRELKMADVKLVREIDSHGRLCLPKSVRQMTGLPVGTPVAMFVDETTKEMLLRRHDVSCIFCGAMEELTVRKGRKVCPACVKGLARMARLPA
jgi:transcriptional pleiotropic regulator of transition state genes